MYLSYISHTLAFFMGLSLTRLIKSFDEVFPANLRRIFSWSFEWPGSEKTRIQKASRVLENVKVELLDKHQVEAVYPPGTWQRQAYDSFVGTLVATDKTFPCIYGTKGFKNNELDFLFLPSEDLNDLNVAKIGAKAILEYHKILATRGRNISLVLVCPPPTKELSVNDYHRYFWSFLKRLRQLDPKPWPAKIPHDTAHREWCMNFDGIEAFFAVLTPAHKQRASRHAENFALVYQPRKIFDIIFKDPKYRESATKMVRGLIDKFDEIPHSPDISDYGVEGTAESRQYYLLDKNEPSVALYPSVDAAAREC